MKMRMAHRPHAIARRVDTTKAEALPCVLTVLTAPDVPCNAFGNYSYDQPVPCGAGEVMNMCLTPAVTAAVQDATGVWFEHFPLVPEEVLVGLDLSDAWR
jgi:CO/xanthine dehydrogenase Mo-binding subunit